MRFSYLTFSISLLLIASTGLVRGDCPTHLESSDPKGEEMKELAKDSEKVVKKIEKKKLCPYAPLPKKLLGEAQKNFCLSFVADYYYRLRFTEETHRYYKQTTKREKISRDGALFMLGQVRSENGWQVDQKHSKGNYWGLGGNYTDEKGQSTMLTFKSFDDGFNYLINHFDHGISPKGWDDTLHPGWPTFLTLLTKDSISDDEINKALNSGAYCQKFPPYNYDLIPGCTGKQCSCQNYAGQILRYSLPLVTSNCLSAFEHYPKLVANSVVTKTKKGEEEEQFKRREESYKELLQYAHEKCEKMGQPF